MEADLTSPSYWGKRQRDLNIPRDRGPLKDLLDSIEPFLRGYEGGRWIELGCSPGHVSCLLYRRIPFAPFGVDSSPEAHLYKDTMARHAGVDATLFQLDVREFITTELFDVVMSFGLIEHFSDPDELLGHHYRLCRRGGLLVVTIPHFRRLQWMYHYLFDRKDLARHNLSMMNPVTFKTFAEKKDMEVLFLRHVGRMNFWNVDATGPRLIAFLRQGLGLATRFAANNLLSYVLPPHRQLYAPWIVFVARKV